MKHDIIEEKVEEIDSLIYVLNNKKSARAESVDAVTRSDLAETEFERFIITLAIWVGGSSLAGKLTGDPYLDDKPGVVVLFFLIALSVHFGIKSLVRSKNDKTHRKDEENIQNEIDRKKIELAKIRSQI